MRTCERAHRRAIARAQQGPRGGVVTQRTANPCTGVRFPPRPPSAARRFTARGFSARRFTASAEPVDLDVSGARVGATCVAQKIAPKSRAKKPLQENRFKKPPPESLKLQPEISLEQIPRPAKRPPVPPRQAALEQARRPKIARPARFLVGSFAPLAHNYVHFSVGCFCAGHFPVMRLILVCFLSEYAPC